ncbi:MAG: hypothetical protein AUG81_07965 [Verrucomicrobia bacterium 13_1_20CM_4_54_11]|nr:MAG: hypothetical protein AUG81_07965 [Verrucomicrobia bacterium 13_1_20CM_4_54_11]
MGARYSDAYADALYLLERGADPNRVAADGMNFSKMLIQHWEHFTKDQAPISCVSSITQRQSLFNEPKCIGQR